ncbi:ABC transporter ATP-binding protein [Longispora albida]|uniref:ABC transporter ATP-binding protein n=1 Tax=Longispora albida TaxID=203523 RepID=UPI0003686B96|nr:ABC transporter ATP-binding protein [Longispora albida]
MTGIGEIARRGGGWLPLIALTSLGGSAAGLALPAVLGRAVDAMASGTGTRVWLAWAAALVAVSVACDLAGTYSSTACVASTTAWLRGRLLSHLLDVEPERCRAFAAGDLVTRVSGNAATAAQAGPSLMVLGAAVLPPVGSLGLLAVLDPWLAVAFLAGLGLVALVLRTFSQRTAEAASRYLTVQGHIAGRLAEALAGIRTIAASGTAELEERRILRPLPELHEHGTRVWRVLARTGAQGTIAGPLVLVAVLATGGLSLVDGRITPGELFAAGQYAAQGAGLGGLTGLLGAFARARAGAARAGEITALPPVRYGDRVLPAGTGRLVFRGVSVPGLRIDLELPGGLAVAVVGRSGAGKSALAALAARLRDPHSGEILLDGVPLAELSRAELRSRIGCAFERPVLVGDTIADAIGMGRPSFRAAAEATRAHDFITRLPEGYGTALADAPMSGGEAQRLGLARAWHADRLLVLDDATSSLDTVTEMRISRTLTEDHGHRTRLIVTHRVSTAARADLVVWLDGGRVRKAGPHVVLWADPEYRAVYG